MKTKQVNRMAGASAWILSLLVMVLFFPGVNRAFGQDQYIMTQKELNDFKLAKRHHYAGEQQFIKGKLGGAEKSFKKCLKIFPKYSSADYYLAKICYQKVDYKQALLHIGAAERNFRYMDNLAVDAQLQFFKRLREERENLQNVLDDPMQKLTPQLIREMEKKMLQIDDHLRNPVPSAQHMPAVYHYVHGNVFFKIKKLKESHDQYLEALKLDPRHTNSYNNLISLFHMVKQYPKAVDYIKQAEANGVTINPKLKDAVLKGLKK